MNPFVLRSELLRIVREYFQKNSFLEVTTPIRIETPALEDHIDAVVSGNQYLRTSPELHMKRLVQGGLPRIYQIGQCFRDGESGPAHHPEFTMLEWYTAGADYRDIMSQTAELIQFVAYELNGSLEVRYQDHTIELSNPWCEVTVDQIFRETTHYTPQNAIAKSRFEQLLVEKVEPSMDRSRPTILIDFPIELGAMARAKPNAPEIAERWELYIGGLEIANAYSELIDADEQRRRFDACRKQRARDNREVYEIDESFLSALTDGMPETAGCALGIDRLLMIFSDSDDIRKMYRQ